MPEDNPASGRTFRAELESRLEGREASDRRLLFVGVLNKHLAPDDRAVLVGGSLVEFYTAGAYTTGDVDLIGRWRAIDGLLEEAGFERSGRYFVREDLGLVVETPKETLRKSETVVRYDVEGLPVYAVSVEDAIVDRLFAAKFWKSETDWEQSILLYATHHAELDAEALRGKATVNDVADTLEHLKNAVPTPPA